MRTKRRTTNKQTKRGEGGGSVLITSAADFCAWFDSWTLWLCRLQVPVFGRTEDRVRAGWIRLPHLRWSEHRSVSTQPPALCPPCCPPSVTERTTIITCTSGSRTGTVGIENLLHEIGLHRGLFSLVCDRSNHDGHMHIWFSYSYRGNTELTTRDRPSQRLVLPGLCRLNHDDYMHIWFSYSYRGNRELSTRDRPSQRLVLPSLWQIKPRWSHAHLVLVQLQREQRTYYMR